jgi:hypothetical protein
MADLKTTTSRRAVLAGIAASPALAAPALGLAAGGPPDPVFAAIEAHRQADAQHGAACHALCEYQESTRDSSGGLTHDLEEQRLDEANGAACHISAEAGRDLFLTVPTTIAGALAVFNYIEECKQAGSDIVMLIMRDEDGEEWGHGYDAILISLREMLTQLRSAVQS